MNDSCDKPTDLTPVDIADKAGELADKMGGGQVCKQAASTAAKSGGASAGASAGASGFGAEVHGEVHGEVHYQDLENSMEQSGCGALSIAAQKIINNTKKIQCIIQKSSNSVEMDVGINASIRIITTDPTTQELQDKANAIKNWQDNNKQADFVDIYERSIEKLNTQLLKGGKDPIEFNIMDAMNAYNTTLQSIANAYSRNINIEGVKINQTISGKIKVLQSLSSTEAAQMENLSKEIASTVAQTAIEQKSGTNALSPQTKSLTDSYTSSNQNLSSGSINAKIQSAKTTIKMNEELIITAPGSINMKNVEINQNIHADIVADAIVSNAIDAGIKTATEIMSSSSIMTTIKTESKGVDDMIAAQGEANAAAIRAAQIVQTGGYSSLLGGLLLLGFLYISKDNPSLQFGLFVIIGIFVAILCVFVFMMWATIMFKIREITGTETIEDKSVKLKRPLELYNKYWQTFDCNTELNYDDVLEYESLSTATMLASMNDKFEKAIANNASYADIIVCFKDGIIPPLYNKIKVKNPKDLTDDEIQYLWKKFKLLTCNRDYSEILKNEDLRKMLDISNVIKAIRDCKVYVSTSLSTS